MTQSEAPDEPQNPGTLAAQLASASETSREALQGSERDDTNGTVEAVMEPTRVAAGTAVAAIATEEGQPDQPEQAPKLYSFAETTAFLREHGIDLEKHREAEVRSAIRWGLVNNKEADRYGASFDDNFEPVSGADLQELVRQLKAHPGPEQRIILAVDDMTCDQAWKRLIKDPITRTYALNRFSRYQRVDPATREPLADQRPTGKAGILFTPGRMNLPDNFRGISANDQLDKMTKGQRYMGPVGWMKLFRQGVDRALPVLFPNEARDLDSLDPTVYKRLVNLALLDGRIDPYLLDTVTGTQFPDLRLGGNANGAVPSLDFSPNPDSREVYLCDYSPDLPDGVLGGRPVLGSIKA